MVLCVPSRLHARAIEHIFKVVVQEVRLVSVQAHQGVEVALGTSIVCLNASNEAFRGHVGVLHPTNSVLFVLLVRHYHGLLVKHRAAQFRVLKHTFAVLSHQRRNHALLLGLSGQALLPCDTPLPSHGHRRLEDVVSRLA